MIPRRILALASLLALTAPLAQAYEHSDADGAHLISVGGGIASPSQTSAANENPAGLIYNNSTSLFGDLVSPNSDLSPIGVAGLLFLGNGTVGADIGLQTYSGGGGNAGDVTLLDLGLAANITDLNMAFGVQASYVVGHDSAANIDSWAMNVGGIYNPNGQFRIGGTLYDVIDNVDAVGAGMGYDLNSNATFDVDGAYDTKGANGKTLKPALGIHVDRVQLAVGYGIKIGDNASAWLPDGSAFGVGFKVTDNAHLQFYYNEMAKYFLGLNYRF